jgi:hypothetical protein
MVGQGVVKAISAIDPMPGGISWSVVPASQFPGGVAQLEDAILREEIWYGLASMYLSCSRLWGHTLS